MIKKTVVGVLIFNVAFVIFFAMLPTKAYAQQFPTQTNSAEYNDANGRVGTVQIRIGEDLYTYCSASSIGDGYWLSNADCFSNESSNVEETNQRINSAIVAIGAPGKQVITTIEELVFAPSAKDYVVDTNGTSWHVNDLVMFKTKENVAPNSFEINRDEAADIVNADLQITGTGMSWQRTYPTTFNLPEDANFYRDADTNQLRINYSGLSASCGGDSGGAIYSLGSNILFGIPNSGNNWKENQGCNANEESANVIGFTPLATEQNQAFINTYYGNLGSDRNQTAPEQPTLGSSAFSSLSS